MGSSQPHTFATLPVEVRLQGLCVFLDTKSLANLSLTCKDMYDTINSFKPLQIRRLNPWKLQFYLRYMQNAHPSCIKRSFSSQSKTQKYPLLFDRVEICDTNFTICLRYRVDSFMKHDRAILLADWHWGSWSFIMAHNGRGPGMELRRNINSHGSDPKQGMVYVCADATEYDNAPSQKYHTVAFSWNRENGGLFSVLYDNVFHNSAKPFDHVTEKDLVVQRSTVPHFCLGWKNDDPTEWLEGDVSHLAIFGRAMLPNEAQHVLSRFEEDAAAAVVAANGTTKTDNKANWVDLESHGYGCMYNGCE